MQEQKTYDDTADTVDDVDAVDLVQLVKVLVKKKWLITTGTLLVTLAAVIISFLLPRVYKSDAFFRLSSGESPDLVELKEIQDKIRENLHNNLLDNQTLQKNMLLNETLQDTALMMKNVSIPDYKKYVSRFTNPQQFLRFLDAGKKNGATAVGDLKQGIRTAEDIAQWIEPVYAYSKKDLKELAQNPKDVKNFVLGVLLQGEKESPQNAQAFVRVIGEFIKDSILHGKLNDYTGTQLNKNRTQAKKYDNFIIKDEFKLRQLETKRTNIQQLLKKYPQAKNMDGRELYSLENSGHRYLSPTAQLVGIESHIADINENLTQNRRNKQLADLKFRFFTRATALMAKETFGYTSLDKVVKLKDTFFKDQNAGEDVLPQVQNELTIDLDNFTNLNREMQFISGPTLSGKAVKPRKAIIIAFAFVMGFFIFVFLAFFVEWWTQNKKKIIA